MQSNFSVIVLTVLTLCASLYRNASTPLMILLSSTLGRMKAKKKSPFAKVWQSLWRKTGNWLSLKGSVQ